MAEIAANLEEIRSRIRTACERAGRDPAEVELLAVSKTFPAAAVREAAEAGQRVFAESRLQELEAKISDCPVEIDWHFIGSVQRNKVRKILAHSRIIHAVDSLRLAAFIVQVAADAGVFPTVFLQVNIGAEETKGGFSDEGLRADFEALLALPRLEIAGLMCIPPDEGNAEAARQWFRKLRKLRDGLETEFSVRLPGLSMGMSGDFETAIEEGATHVRVGSAIFGKRSYRVDGELG